MRFGRALGGLLRLLGGCVAPDGDLLLTDISARPVKRIPATARKGP